MNKRLLILIGSFVLAVIVMVGFIFFVKYRTDKLNAGTASNNANNSGNNGNNANNNNSGNQNTGTTNPISRISDVPVISPTFSYDQLSVWYFTSDGHLFKQNTESGIKQEFVLPNNYKTDSVIWPNAGNNFIIVSSAGGTSTYYYYNSETKTFFAYPANVKSVDFLPDGKHVIYEWDDAKGAASLSMGNFDLSGHKPLVNLPDSNMIVKVSPIGNKVLLYKRGNAADGKVYYLALDTNKIFPIRTASSNAVLWSPDGQKFLFNKLGADNDKTNKQLWIGDIIGGADKNLNIITTIQKSTFTQNGNFLYTAIPSSSGSDVFWKIDTKSLNKTQVFAAAQNVSLSGANLLVRNDGRFIFYTGPDGYLYSMIPQQ